MEGQNYEIEVDITAGVNTHVNHECRVKVDGVLDHDSTIREVYEFSVYVGEEWGLSMVLPSMVTLDVGTEKRSMWQLQITELKKIQSRLWV